MKQRPLNGRILVSDCLGLRQFNTQLLYFTCSSLSKDGERVYMMSERTGSPNVMVRDLFTGKEKILTKNDKGTLKSYVYFDGTFNQGLGKASVCLDYERPDDYNAYEHFTMDHKGNLVCDGYFKYPWEIKKVRENSTDNGPDPHKKGAEYICKVIPDWDKGELEWIPLCRHESDWPGCTSSSDLQSYRRPGVL